VLEFRVHIRSILEGDIHARKTEIVVIFPFTEVADVSYPTNACRPRCIAIHDGIVYTNGEQDCSAVPAFSLKSSFDFVFYPRALDRVLGENDEQFVMKADRIINASAESVADL